MYWGSWSGDNLPPGCHDHHIDEMDDNYDDEPADEQDPYEFSESAEGYEARHEWARRYDALDGAPEGDWDR